MDALFLQTAIKPTNESELLFHVFRHDREGRLEFVGSTQTLDSSRHIVRSKTFEPMEEFVIYNVLTHELVYLRADQAAG